MIDWHEVVGRSLFWAVEISAAIGMLLVIGSCFARKR